VVNLGVMRHRGALRRQGAVVPLLLLAASSAAAGDAEGCRDLPVLQRLPGCSIRECRTRDFDEAELQAGPVDSSGDFPKKLVEGELAVVTYACPAALRLEAIAKQAQAALRRAGYTFVYTGSMLHSDLPGFTARRGSTWVQLVGETFDPLTGYTVTLVRSDPGGAPRPARAAPRLRP
jgi:hypothetical protein